LAPTRRIGAESDTAPRSVPEKTICNRCRKDNLH
jgi:hypothetical protein